MAARTMIITLFAAMGDVGGIEGCKEGENHLVRSHGRRRRHRWLQSLATALVGRGPYGKKRGSLKLVSQKSVDMSAPELLSSWSVECHQSDTCKM
jgi:hypothetical protein